MFEDSQPSTGVSEGKKMFKLKQEVGPMLSQLLSAEVHHMKPVDGRV